MLALFVLLCYNGFTMGDFTYDEQNCKLCPVACGANREQRVGACGADNQMRIAKYSLHPFEEPCISHKNGSGTIFFTGCSLKCVFCQNYEVSRAQRGKIVTPEELADIFRHLEEMGAENVSLVSAQHFIPYLVRSFEIYRPKIPVVYNSGGYENIDALKQLDPYVDIYLPDMKFYSPTLAKRYTGREDYFEVADAAIRFMAGKRRKMTEDGKMLSGLIVRHLVMPLGVADSRQVVRWFAREMPEDAYLSLMSQYTPFGKIDKFPELSRPIKAREYDAVLSEAVSLGLSDRLFAQELSSSGEKYIPSWDF